MTLPSNKLNGIKGFFFIISIKLNIFLSWFKRKPVWFFSTWFKTFLFIIWIKKIGFLKSQLNHHQLLFYLFFKLVQEIESFTLVGIRVVEMVVALGRWSEVAIDGWRGRGRWLEVSLFHFLFIIIIFILFFSFIIFFKKILIKIIFFKKIFN